MHRLPLFLLGCLGLLLLWSGINPYDRFTWVLEVLPALIGLFFIFVFYPQFRFSDFTLVLIALEMAILIIGGHYSYARMPLFSYFQECFDWQRNDYDRLGHFAQGFVPALIAREVLLRLEVVKSEGWRLAFVLSFALAISAAYELVEFLVAQVTGTAAEEFLGTQGDIWDSQWDMTWALIGALVAMAFFRKWQDASMAKLDQKKRALMGEK